MTYPPDYQESQDLFHELQRLDRSERAPSGRKYEIIHDLAEAKFYEAKEYLIKGMDNPDPDYRYACISALVTHWRDADPRIIEKIRLLAEHDPDEDVRRISAESLGILGVKGALPLLKRIVSGKAEPSLYVMGGAYQAILRLLHQTSKIEEMAGKPFRLSQVDKDLLNSID